MNRVLASLAIVAVLAAPTAVASKLQKNPYRVALNLAGQQSMLTQKMSAEMLLVALGVEREQNLASLEDSRRTFDRTLTALRNGDEALGLRVAEDPQVLDRLMRVESAWRMFDASLRGLDAGTVTPKEVGALVGAGMDLLDATNGAEMAYHASSPSGVFTMLAMALKTCGTQRTLTQQLAKEFLLVVLGYEVEKNRASLAANYMLFDRTLKGMIEGNPELKLIKAPTRELRAQLRAAELLWNQIRPVLQQVAEGGVASPEQIAKVAETNEALLQEIDKAAAMYERL